MDDHDRSTGARASSGGFWRSRAGLTLIGFLTIAGLLLAFEHRAHVFTGIGPLALLLLLCVGMHAFMHGGHGHGGGRHGDNSGDGQ